ncbi:MAG: glucokinase [Chloroflexi bacterium]|nr:glucokinase [Chloroflexota bacterium]
MDTKSHLLLAGDIGGTKTTLAIYPLESTREPSQGSPRSPVDQATFPSGKYASLEAVVAEFLQRNRWRVERASFGVAGPVFHGRVQATNLPWLVDESTLSDQLGAPAKVLNDLEAIAYGLPYLNADDLITINPGSPEPHGGLAVIAPGTGLGEAFLVWDAQTERYLPHASEGGHADFAPATPLELELLDYLQPRLQHVSYERVCSGIGIPNIYSFLRDTPSTHHYEEPEWLAAALAGADDPTRVIMEAAEARKAEICVATVELFASVLASEAGNLALKVLATGGVYLGGGIPPRILPYLKPDKFLPVFSQKGRMTDLLLNVPVHVIRNPEVALFGAACYGMLQMH